MEEFLKKLAKPAQRALQNNKIASLTELCKYTEAEIKAWHGIGPNALKQICSPLKKKV